MLAFSSLLCSCPTWFPKKIEAVWGIIQSVILAVWDFAANYLGQCSTSTVSS